MAPATRTHYSSCSECRSHPPYYLVDALSGKQSSLGLPTLPCTLVHEFHPHLRYSSGCVPLRLGSRLGSARHLSLLLSQHSLVETLRRAHGPATLPLTASISGAVTSLQCPIWALETPAMMVTPSWEIPQQCLRHRRYTLPQWCLRHRQYTIPQWCLRHRRYTLPQWCLRHD